MSLIKFAWAWNTGTPQERGEMVRRHFPERRDNLLELFQLTEDGLDKILCGDEWRPEYEQKS